MRARQALRITLLAIGVSLLVSYGVNAYRSAGAPVPLDPFASLGLSSAQLERIREVSRPLHPQLVALQADVDAKRAALAELLAGPSGGDEAAISGLLAEIARLESARDREVVRSLQLLKPHLSVEQQRTLFRHIELSHAPAARQR
jgi:hypothetical protein